MKINIKKNDLKIQIFPIGLGKKMNNEHYFIPLILISFQRHSLVETSRD